MKYLFILLSMTIFSAASYASYTTCSSSNLYYSNIRHDFGIRPPAGTELGTIVIVFNRVILLNKSRIAELGQHRIDSYQVELVDSSIPLESTGDQTFGSDTYKKTVVLYKMDEFNPSKKTEIARENAICKNTWAMVP